MQDITASLSINYDQLPCSPFLPPQDQNPTASTITQIQTNELATSHREPSYFTLTQEVNDCLVDPQPTSHIYPASRPHCPQTLDQPTVDTLEPTQPQNPNHDFILDLPKESQAHSAVQPSQNPTYVMQELQGVVQGFQTQIEEIESNVVDSYRQIKSGMKG